MVPGPGTHSIDKRWIRVASQTLLIAPVALSSWLLGCTNTLLLQSPKTLPAGQTTHTTGVEVYGIALDDDTEAVGAPFYMARIGLMEHVELGVRSTLGFTNMALDLKLQLIDTAPIDLSVAPRISYGWFTFSTSFPVLVGINLSESVQLLAMAQAQYVLGTEHPFDENDFDADRALQTDAALYLGFGAGIYFRVQENLGIVSEFQASSGLPGNTPLLLSGGIALVFGRQPHEGGPSDLQRASDSMFPAPGRPTPDSADQPDLPEGFQRNGAIEP